MLRLSQRTKFHFVWLPESISKVRKCLFDRISNPLERKLFVYPPWVWIFSGTTHSRKKIQTYTIEGHQKFLGGGGQVLKVNTSGAKYETKLEFPGGRGAKHKTFLCVGEPMDIFWNWKFQVSDVSARDVG